jgi:hypothetical protein
MASIIRTDSLQNLNTSNIISQTNATTLTLGYSGQTIAVASGATLLGGGITWTSNVVTSALTVAVNTGYFVNTSSNAITVTLPASASVGNTIILSDFNRTFATNNLTLSTNALNFQGATSPNPVYSTDGQTVQLVYSGATKGWIPISDDDVALETPQTYSVDFLVIAGGGCGSGATAAGGGGAGGYRSSNATYGSSGGGASAESSLSLTPGTVYTITVGAGGAGVTGQSTVNNGVSRSISGTGITTITSIGGGGGANEAAVANTGGSGGGGQDTSGFQTGASGTANQGYAGGNGAGTNSGYNGGGGGGAGAVGVNASGGSGGTAGNGGVGTASSITGSSVTRAGGGGGASYNGTIGSGGTGGGGNGGRNTSSISPTNGTANTGSGGGGSGTNGTSGAGGSGVIILRMLTSRYSGTTTGSPTVSTSGSDTILTYTGSGSYTG